LKKRDIVIATSNQGKIEEFKELLPPSCFNVKAQVDFGLETPPETGLSFVENSILKARYVCKQTGMLSLADDSGLCVPSLGGAPGIFSSRYGGEGSSAAKNMEKLLSSMSGSVGTDRICFFVCVLALLKSQDDAMPYIVTKTWKGEVLNEPRGENGFGYDPIFYVPDYKCSAAQLPSDLKNKISHRGQAMKAFLDGLEVGADFGSV
jgi:XTP/dITP diphosphohydrolase